MFWIESNREADVAKRKTVQRIENTYQNRIRSCRLRAEIVHQSDLSRRTGISRSTLNALENNKLFLSSTYALLISETLGCKLDDLFEKKQRANESDIN